MVKETDDAMLHLFIDIQMAGDFSSLMTPSQGQVCGHPSKWTMTHKLMDQMKCSYHLKLNALMHNYVKKKNYIIQVIYFK